MSRITLAELKKQKPHPYVIEQLKLSLPVVIGGNKEVEDLRWALRDVTLKLRDVEYNEFWFESGIVWTDNGLFTHQNPIQDQIDVVPGHDPEKFPESYRKCKWPKVEGFKDVIKSLFNHYRNYTIEIASHIDAYMHQQNVGPKYQSIEKMTRETKLGTSRSFYYNERTEADKENDRQLNWHYDRMNFGGLMKDIYLMHGEYVDDPANHAFTYNDSKGNKIVPILNDDDIGVHAGMTLNIFTAGEFGASNHCVMIPNKVGLARISQAFFMSPMPDTIIEPPHYYDFPNVPEWDDGVLDPQVGYRMNYAPHIHYAQWNENLQNSFVKVFSLSKKKGASKGGY